MTPMIDVVFLLIIFFLVSSHLAKQENHVELQLPEASSAVDEDVERETLVVNILKTGAWQVGGAELNELRLAAAIRERQSASQEPLRLKIRTDESVPYDRIEPVLKQASLAGIGDIVFSVYEDRGS